MPDIPRGVSGVFKNLMPLCVGDDGRDFLKSGCQVKLPNGECVLIFCDISFVIGDEAALHYMFACKGSSGLKPCMICYNVWNRQYAQDIVKADRTRTSVYHTEEEIDRCKVATADVIIGILERLKVQHAVLGKTKLDKLETQLGWNYAPDGIMFCPLWRRRVCPSKVVLYDFCHVLFVNGMFNLHAGLPLTNLKALSTQPAAIGEYVKIWIWPHNISSAIKQTKRLAQHAWNRPWRKDSSNALLQRACPCCQRWRIIAKHFWSFHLLL